jgi:hypothetical protein
MAIKAAIRNLIVNDATLSALVGTRVSPVIAKTGDILPRITYSIMRTGRDFTTNETLSMRDEGFSFVICAKSSGECDQIAFELERVLSAAIQLTSDGTRIVRCYPMGESESTDYLEGREKPIYEKTAVYDVIYYG